MTESSTHQTVALRRDWVIARPSVLRAASTRQPTLLELMGEPSWDALSANAAANHGFIDATHVGPQLSPPPNGAFGMELAALPVRRCVVIFAPTHALVAHEMQFEDRPSIGHVDYRRVDGVWKPGTQGCLSAAIVDFPDAAPEFGADDGVEPQDAAVGYWAAMLIAAGRAQAPHDALPAAAALLAKAGVTYTRGLGIIDELNAMLGMGGPLGRASN